MREATDRPAAPGTRESILFNVVMPTPDRPRLVGRTIRRAPAQDHDRFELDLRTTDECWLSFPRVTRFVRDSLGNAQPAPAAAGQGIE